MHADISRMRCGVWMVRGCLENVCKVGSSGDGMNTYLVAEKHDAGDATGRAQAVLQLLNIPEDFNEK